MSSREYSWHRSLHRQDLSRPVLDVRTALASEIQVYVLYNLLDFGLFTEDLYGRQSESLEIHMPIEE